MVGAGGRTPISGCVELPNATIRQVIGGHGGFFALMGDALIGTS
jgi:hypothetical protein